LEDWNMTESPTVNSWIHKGELQGIVKKGRADVLKVLEKKLRQPVPEAIRLAVEGTNDPATLERWLDAALEVASYAEFRARVQVPE
jgi:hypothetical protein